MNNKLKKLLEFLYYFLIIFILINIFLIPETFAISNSITISSNVPGWAATLAKIIIGFVQVLASGYFVIILTMNGISYFTAVAASDKADCKGKISRTLFFALITFLGMYLFSYVIGL